MFHRAAFQRVLHGLSPLVQMASWSLDPEGTAMRLILIALFLGLFLINSNSRADDSWAGKQVILKRQGIWYGRTDPKTGREVYFGELRNIWYEVRGDQDGFLRVHQADTEGWFPKGEAVLLDDAVQFFTQVIDKDNKCADALVRRASAWQLKGEPGSALMDLDQALRLDPRNA